MQILGDGLLRNVSVPAVIFVDSGSKLEDLEATYLLILLQVEDLIEGYRRLLTRRMFLNTSKAALYRLLIENIANYLFIRGNKERANAYFLYHRQIGKRIKHHLDVFEGIEYNTPQIKSWTTSSSFDRVKLLGDSALAQYELLSNFVHGNNTALFAGEDFSQGLDAQMTGLLLEFIPKIVEDIEAIPQKNKAIINELVKQVSVRQFKLLK